MKPDWSKAPEWAEWCAQDGNGDWYWYSTEPRFAGSEWYTDGDASFAGSIDPTKTLESRPCNSN